MHSNHENSKNWYFLKCFGNEFLDLILLLHWVWLCPGRFMMDDDVLLYPLFYAPSFRFPLSIILRHSWKCYMAYGFFFHIGIAISQFKKGRAGREDGKTKKICRLFIRPDFLSSRHNRRRQLLPLKMLFLKSNIIFLCSLPWKTIDGDVHFSWCVLAVILFSKLL